MFTVYALHPSFNRIYIGFSSDLEGRVQSPNHLATKGYTVPYRPWIVVFDTKAEAIKREKELKSA